MAIGSIFLGLALLLLVALFLARPLLLKHSQPHGAYANERHQLEQEKEAYLGEIRALDFDHETGKIPTEVYQLQRDQLRSEAAAILKTLDELPEADGDVYAQIEAAVASRRHQQALSANGQISYCTACGQPLDQGDKFCASCGQPVEVAAPIS
jgi:hypothetical protein